MAEMARERRAKPPIQPDRPIRTSSADGSGVAKPRNRHQDSAKTDSSQNRAADVSSPTEETLRKRVTELEATNAALWKKIAAQDRQLADLKAGFGELRREREQPGGEAKAAARIGDRAGGGPASDAHRESPKQGWRLPSDAKIGFGVAVAGGIATTAADFVRYIPAETAGIGATALGVWAAGVAVWRERKKENDAGH
jgi:hypothetical protein